MSYTDELGRRVAEQDRDQVEASQKGLRASRERREKSDYENAVKEFDESEKQREKEIAEYEKQKAIYDAEQSKLAEILKDKREQEAKQQIETASDRHGAVFNYRDTKYVKEYLGLNIRAPESDALRKKYTDPKTGNYFGDGSDLNRALNFDKHTWLGGSVEQWKEIIAREDADRKLSQEQSKYLRESGNAQIRESQSKELIRLGSSGSLDKTGQPNLISATLTQKMKDGFVSKPIPVAQGIAEKSQNDFSKGYTLESKLQGFIPSLDVLSLREKPVKPESFEARKENVLSMSKQTEKAQNAFGILNSNSKEEFHIGNEKSFYFNGQEVKDKSAIRLIEFQQGLKTTKRPSPTIYKGILEESNLPVTPLATKIIDTLSSKGTFLGFLEPKYAYGEKAKVTNPITGEFFDMQTKTGSPKIAKELGFVYSQNMELPQITKLGIGDANLQYSLGDIETVKAPIGNLDFIIKTNQLTPNPKSKDYIPQLQAPQGIKPISSSGQRFEFLLNAIEKEQLRASKYDDDVGKMYHAGLEFSKDLVSGGAFIENLAWQGEALIRGGSPKTREIQIPHTMFTTGLDQIIQKNPIMVIPSMMAYEKKYGKGSGLGAGASLLLPIPGSEVKLGEIPLRLKNAVPSYVRQPIGKVAERLHYPVLKNKLEGIYFNIETAKNLRTVTKYAISRQQEGIFGIEKVNPKLFIITRGLEESALPKVRGYAEKTVIGFTKKDNQLNPIYSKTPSKQIFPYTQKAEPIVSLSIIKFERRKPTLVTDIFKPDKPVTPVSQRIVVSSLDPDFYRQARTLKLSNIKQTTYDIRNPTMKQTTEYFKLEKESQLNLVALGYTAPLKQVKELSKIEKLFRVKQSPMSFVGSKAQVTRFYETQGMGLGKGKGFIERIVSKDFISVGSKDMDKALERAGLGTKRTKEQTTPYDVSSYKISGMGTGKATALTELTKQNVKVSMDERPKIKRAEFKTPNIIKPIQTNYLQQRDTFKSKYEYKQADEIQYESLKFPEIQKPVIEIKLNSLVSTRQQTKTRTETKSQTKQNTIEVQKLQPLQMERIKLDNALVTRQRIRERQVTRQAPKMAIRQIEIPILRIKPMQTPKLRERQLMKTPTLLKQKTLFRTRDPTETTKRPPRRPVIPFWFNDDIKRKKSKDESKKGNWFAGSVSDVDITIAFKRQDLTLGSEKKISNLVSKDRSKVLGLGKSKVKFF